MSCKRPPPPPTLLPPLVSSLSDSSTVTETLTRRGRRRRGRGGEMKGKRESDPFAPVMDIAIVYLHIATADPFKHSFIYYR